MNSIAIISKTQEKGNEVNSKSTDEEKFQEIAIVWHVGGEISRCATGCDA